MREYTPEDRTIFQALENLQFLSKCIDKKVVCIITDEDYHVLSVGINTIEVCDQNCDDKEHRLCVVKHAEVVAVENLSFIGRQRARRAYVNLFPCVACQRAIDPYVDEIVAFGKIHKAWESEKIVVFQEMELGTPAIVWPSNGIGRS